MLSQSNYLSGLKVNEGNHITNILSPYEFLMMRTPEPQMLRKGKVPTSLLKQKKIQRTDHKLPILQWFTTLAVDERQKVTQIQNDVIVEMAVQLAGSNKLQSLKVSVDFSKTQEDCLPDERFKVRMFHTRNASTDKIEAQRYLIQSIRIVGLGRPGIYLTSSFVQNPQKCLACLSSISEGQIFKSTNNTSSNQFSNPLWFSRYSFNTFGEWICSSLEETILRKYQNSLKIARGCRIIESEFSSLTFSQQFAKFYQKNQQKKQQTNQNELKRWLSLKITDSNKIQIQQSRQRFKDLVFKFNEEKTKQLWDNIDYVPTGRKKARKAYKKKKVQKVEVEFAKEIVQEAMVEPQIIIQDIACLLTKDTSGIETKQVQDFSGDISMISQIVCTEPDLPIKKQSSQIYFIEEEKTEQPVQIQGQIVTEQVLELQKEEKQQQPIGDYGLSHSTSDSLEQKKRRKNNKNTKKSRRRVPDELINYVYTQWCETGLQSFVDGLSIQSNKLFEARLIVFERIRNLVMKLHGEYTVDAKLFGSCSVGLALPTSDIDILLTGFNLQNQLDCTQLLQKLSLQLKKMKWTVDCAIYPTAKVPIIKVSVNPNIPFLSCYTPDSEQFAMLQTIPQNLQISKPVNQIIKIDITIEVKNTEYGHLGFKSTQFMKNNIETTEYLHPVVLTLKYLLSEKKLNKPYKGGLSSFGLLILCSAYMKSFSSYKSLSQAFLKLLQFYSDVFDGDKQSITLYQNCPCFTQRHSIQNIAPDTGLSIVDPLSGRVMTANCSGFYLIKYQFKRIFSTILKVKQTMRNELKQMDINEFKSLKQGKKKPRDRWVRKYLQNYSIKQILNQEQ